MSSVVHPDRGTIATCASRVGLAFLEGRPVVLGVFALRFVVGTLLVVGADWSSPGLWLATISWLLTVWAVYLINGISDIEGDRLNGSSRPLASGRLEVPAAWAIAAILLTLSLLLASLFPRPFLLAVLAFVGLGLVYSVGPWAAKKAAVAALAVAAVGVFLTYLAAALVVGGTVSASAVVFAAVASSWIAVVGHTKDFGDVAGDAADGRRTLPVMLGAERARVVVAAGTGVVSAAALALGALVHQLRTLLVLGAAGPIVIVVTLLAGGGDRRGEKRPYRSFMAGQYALNVAALLGALES
ncbi:UbiA family prenyltransferase [Leifsonia soli]|uniref:4-hydroxybenzoate polyprenyltransferase n=1 Tax=Leifsonia soli TaxID=582665 RepID=A0A852T5T0_9MICO|nr:UbiA family prenyltransferase [Leifsonia soli]NYD76163.1 4-hydroxybenzoate polyprenyltransferase [Leifsonia soli]